MIKMSKMNSKVYKWCAVPQCSNTIKKTPNKLFIYVPNKKAVRDKWMELARRDPRDVTLNSAIYFCEDHFDLPHDMENYMQYHLMGYVSQVRTIPGCMPTKFDCQKDRKQTLSSRKRLHIITKRKKMVFKESENNFEESDIVENHIKLEKMDIEIEVSAVQIKEEDQQDLQERISMVWLNEEPFGTFKNEPVRKFIWTTDTGFSVSVISYGAIVQSIQVPGKKDGSDWYTNDVVLGFDDIDGYVNRNDPHLGSTIGRCANRIGGASFDIDGKTYTLAKNVGQDHLHGGLIGFDQVNWNSTRDGNKVIFSYLSKDGEEGYPGDLVTSVVYEVKDDDTLYVEFIATTTKKTVVNLTNHSYFNLAGHDAGAQEIYNHVVTINADRITETTSESIPTGRFINVGGTPFDLRVPTRLRDAMEKGAELFDDNFCVNTYDKQDINFVSRVTHPGSGRYMELYSDQPGVQLYTSNFLPSPGDTALVGKSGSGYRRHGAFCLETQNYPDAVHHAGFPTAILKPGEIYRHRVNYRFGVVEANGPEVIMQ